MIIDKQFEKTESCHKTYNNYYTTKIILIIKNNINKKKIQNYLNYI